MEKKITRAIRCASSIYRRKPINTYNQARSGIKNIIKFLNNINLNLFYAYNILLIL